MANLSGHLRRGCAILGVLATGWLSAAHAQIYVVAGGSGNISEYDTAGTLLNPSIIKETQSSPQFLAFSGSNLYVTDSGSGTVRVYSSSGTKLSASLITGLDYPTAIAISGTDLYVATGGGDGKIEKYTTSGTRVSSSFITSLYEPTGIAVSGTDLYVCSADGVGKYTTSGAVVATSLIQDSLEYPVGIATDGSNLYVADSVTGFIGKFTTDGAVVNAQLIQPPGGVSGLAISGNYLFAMDDINGVIGVYDTSGGVINDALVDGLTTSQGIAIGPTFTTPAVPPGRLDLIHKFVQNDGQPTRLIRGSDGAFYGATSGSDGHGTVFRLAADGTFTTLHVFDGTDGNDPQGALVDGGDGYFYGTTYGGGVSNSGTVFKITADGTFSSIHSFDGTDGQGPVGSLIVGSSDGLLYGTTYLGGTGPSGVGGGTAFKMTTDGMITSLHSFSSANSDGFDPDGGLVQVDSTTFLGTTSDDGTGNGGSIYTIASDQTFSVLHPFHLDGFDPSDSLVKGSDGAFYGTTTLSSIFKITSDGHFTSLHSFSGLDGGLIEGGLAIGADGAFYGTSYAGGPFLSGGDFGTIFRITTDGTFTSLHHFVVRDNALEPSTGFVLGDDGALYGTTTYSPYDAGARIFRFSMDGSSASLIKQVKLSHPTYTINESGGSIDIAVQRVGGNIGAFSVTVNTANGTATSGKDYTALVNQVVTFDDGDSADKLVNIPILEDTLREGNETFTIALSAPTDGASLAAPSTATVTITDDDSPPTITSQSGSYAALLPGGYFYLTLQKSAQFSGYVIVNNIRHSLSGQLDYKGDYNGAAASSVPVSLHVDLDGNMPSSVAVAGGSAVSIYQSAYVAGQTIAETPKYTLLLKPTANGTDIPQGIGYGTLSVAKGGLVKFVAMLADHTALSASGLLVGDGNGHHQFVLYDPVYAAKGQVSGAIVFENKGTSDCDGSLAWFKPMPKTAAYFPNGINTSVALTGATYVAPLKTVLAPPFGAGSGTASFVDQSPVSLSKALTVTLPLDKVTVKDILGGATNVNKVSLKINATTGSFSGSFVHPTSHKSVTFAGLLYQNTTTPQGGGFYLGLVNGVGYSGSVTLTP